MFVTIPNLVWFRKDSKAMSKQIKPGTPAPVSGQYERFNRLGNPTGNEVTAVRGKPLPPTPHSGQSYKLVDKTKHAGRP